MALTFVVSEPNMFLSMAKTLKYLQSCPFRVPYVTRIFRQTQMFPSSEWIRFSVWDEVLVFCDELFHLSGPLLPDFVRVMIVTTSEGRSE